MPDLNPYKLLQVSRSAGTEEIEDAYERLFDKYEPKAHAGDLGAVRMLEDLNEAHDILLDPQRRADLDASLTPVARQASQGQGRRGSTQVIESRQRTASRTAVAPPRGRGGVTSTAARRRVAPAPPPRSALSPAFLVSGGLLLILVVAVAVFLITANSGGRGTALQPTPVVPNLASLQATATAEEILNSTTYDISQQPTPATVGGMSTSDPNKVVATVNNQPIYMRELTTRYVKDLIIAASDPIMGPLLSEQSITATRMLDIISQDSLDKQINMQVILQEAKKEGLYPSDDQIANLEDQAKQQDLKGTPFPDFLSKNRITEEQYRDNVVRNVVYAVMASKHMPETGADDVKQNAFIEWICTARKGYDVKILLNFTQANQPCSSGLPSDIPLSSAPPDNGGQEPPPVQTGGPNP